MCRVRGLREEEDAEENRERGTQIQEKRNPEEEIKKDCKHGIQEEESDSKVVLRYSSRSNMLRIRCQD